MLLLMTRHELGQILNYNKERLIAIQNALPCSIDHCNVPHRIMEAQVYRGCFTGERVNGRYMSHVLHFYSSDRYIYKQECAAASTAGRLCEGVFV